MAELTIPHHIALIPDGNRRWARERNLPTLQGHKKGFEGGIELARKIRAMGVHTLTVWVFSTENWKRDKEEVSYLMNIYDSFMDEIFKDAVKEQVRVCFLGRRDRLSEKLTKKMEQIERDTAHFTEHVLNIAIDYGGRDEIVRAMQKIAQKVVNKEIEPDEITETVVSDNLDTAQQPYPEPDIVIRTSGEQRISGFMPWQAGYTEYFFLDKYFPDLTGEDIEKVIEEYSNRQRRFGK